MAEDEEQKVEATGSTGGGDAGAATTEPPPPPPVARRILTRSRTNRMVAGVAGGLGQYFGVDPILIRLGFAFFALLGGAGIALYLAAWLLVPAEGELRSVGEVAAERASTYVGQEERSWLWIGAVVFGGLIVITNLDGMHYSGAWFWGILLIAGGIWLYRQDGAAAAVAPPVPPQQATSANIVSDPAASYAPARPVVARPAPVRPAPRPPRSALGRYTLALTLVALGIAAMLDNAGAVYVSRAEYGAVALTTVGAGLLAGSLFGKARGLIFWGLVLTLFVVVGGDADMRLDSGFGDRSITPAQAQDLTGTNELFAGTMTFDLSGMEWGDQPARIDAEVVFGKIEVLVPEGVDVRFTGHAEMGAIELFDEARQGPDISLNGENFAGGGPELVIDARVFMGQVAVSRTGMPARELS